MRLKLALVMCAIMLLFACAYSEEADRAVCYPSFVQIECWQKSKPEIVIMPQSADQNVVFEVENPEIALVAGDGTVIGLTEGQTCVLIKNAGGKLLGKIEVEVLGGIELEGVAFDCSETEIALGESCTLAPIRTPENATKALAFKSSDEGVALVDAFGNVTGVSAGSAIIRASSVKDGKIYADITVNVIDPSKINEIYSPLEGGITLNAGEAITIEYSVKPETAPDTVTITSSREDIVSVKDGVATAVKSGFSTITLRDYTNPDTALSFNIYVSGGDVAVTLPLRRTDASGIEENLCLIEALRQSALDMVASSKASSIITAHEAEDRNRIIDRAFEMYAFPWTVEQERRYWNEEYSENGAKNFKPGTIYYGLPYISGYNSCRLYNVKKALEDGSYVKSTDGSYYIMTPYEGWGYAGNDCSAFVALALWGYTSYEGETIKTYTLFNDTRLQVLTDTEMLQPGDILVWHSSHVVMFLYWLDDGHTQAMFLQQGGDEPAINTVNAVAKEISFYTDNYYQMRRLADFRFY